MLSRFIITQGKYDLIFLSVPNAAHELKNFEFNELHFNVYIYYLLYI